MAIVVFIRLFWGAGAARCADGAYIRGGPFAKRYDPLFFFSANVRELLPRRKEGMKDEKERGKQKSNNIDLPAAGAMQTDTAKKEAFAERGTAFSQNFFLFAKRAFFLLHKVSKSFGSTIEGGKGGVCGTSVSVLYYFSIFFFLFKLCGVLFSFFFVPLFRGSQNVMYVLGTRK